MTAKSKNTLVEAAIAGIVGGAALAAGSELWSFLSPAQRRFRRIDALEREGDQVEAELDEQELYE
jgi:AmiR/NasT family two-component response regulator